MKSTLACLSLLLNILVVSAQQPMSTTMEKKVGLSEPAIALDASGNSALEATLLTSNLNGTVESPVANVRVTIRNSSSVAFAFISGIVTFYDSAGVRCAEGVVKSEALAVGEHTETDVPGIRIRCTAASWRLVATNLVPRSAASTVISVPPTPIRLERRLVISIDGEQHPIQLDKPIKLNVGEKERTIILHEEP